MGKSTINGHFHNSYVSLPEGSSPQFNWQIMGHPIVPPGISWMTFAAEREPVCYSENPLAIWETYGNPIVFHRKNRQQMLQFFNGCCHGWPWNEHPMCENDPSIRSALSTLFASQTRQTMSGWWYTNPSEKYESQWEGISHILWKIKNVPNHQPDVIWSISANI